MTDATGQPLHDLTAFQRDMLVAVETLDVPKGVAVKAYLAAEYSEDITNSRLYTNLDTLVDKGLVEKSQRDRRTNEHTLTQRGRRELTAHRQWMDRAEAEA